MSYKKLGLSMFKTEKKKLNCFIMLSNTNRTDYFFNVGTFKGLISDGDLYPIKHDTKN